MKATPEEKRIELWSELLRKGKRAKLRKKLEKSPPIEIADFFEKYNDRDVSIEFLSDLPNDISSPVFVEISDSFKLDFFESLPKRKFASIFSQIESNHRADFYRQLDQDSQAKLLPYLNKSVRQDVITLSAYPNNTVGSSMSTDFATVILGMTNEKAIEKIREDAPSKKMMYYLYVVDENMIMVGFLSLKDLIMSPLSSNISHLVHRDFVSARVDDDKEVVAKQIEKYDLLAIPILNQESQLVGILRYDDAMDIIRAEETEDMERFMGIISNNDDDGANYIESSVFYHFKKRIAWITGLFAMSFFSELLIHKNEFLLQKIQALSLYLTMITGVGGNAGSQSATVVIRALSLDNVSVKNWLSTVFKEVRIAVMISLCLFLISYMKVFLMSSDIHSGGLNIHRLAFSVSLALCIQIISSAAIGAVLPLLAKSFGGDPAVIASPAITTLVDITGMLIYFTVNFYLLL